VTLLIMFIEDRTLGLAAIGAIGVMVGSALPWIHVSQPLIGITTGNGLEDAGKITVVLGALALGLMVAYARLRARDLALGAGLAGLAATGFAAAFLADLPHNAARVLARLLSGDQPPIDPGQVAAFPARAGAGLFVVFAGAAVLAAAVVALVLRSRTAQESASSAPD